MKNGLVSRWLSKLFLGYLRLISATAKIEIKNLELIRENTIVGFWHGDSYSMMLVLQELRKITAEHRAGHRKRAGIPPINVIVTSGFRGESIEYVLRTVGAKAIRLPDGIRIRRFLRDLEQLCAGTREVVAASLDGPQGPMHEPKKLLFHLANRTGKEMCYVYMQYSRVLRLNHRWDKYCIPLPFTKITACVEHLGQITQATLDDFLGLKNSLKVC